MHGVVKPPLGGDGKTGPFVNGCRYEHMRVNKASVDLASVALADL
jgi:hypothetical protein